MLTVLLAEPAAEINADKVGVLNVRANASIAGENILEAFTPADTGFIHLVFRKTNKVNQ